MYTTVTIIFYIMESILKIDDSALLSKHIIKSDDIMALLPQEIKEQVRNIEVMVDRNPRWVIFLKGGGAYHYEPLNKDKEMYLDVSGVKPAYGKIYLCLKTRVLRREESEELKGDKYYAVFLCRPRHMLLWRELKNTWFTQDESGPGFGTTVKWFRHFDI